MELMHRMQLRDKYLIKDPCKARTTEEVEAATNKITTTNRDSLDLTPEMVVALPIIISRPSNANFMNKVRKSDFVFNNFG
jgi:hypothetical protein